MINSSVSNAHAKVAMYMNSIIFHGVQSSEKLVQLKKNLNFLNLALVSLTIT